MVERSNSSTAARGGRYDRSRYAAARARGRWRSPNEARRRGPAAARSRWRCRARGTAEHGSRRLWSTAEGGSEKGHRRASKRGDSHLRPIRERRACQKHQQRARRSSGAVRSRAPTCATSHAAAPPVESRSCGAEPLRHRPPSLLLPAPPPPMPPPVDQTSVRRAVQRVYAGWQRAVVPPSRGRGRGPPGWRLRRRRGTRAAGSRCETHSTTSDPSRGSAPCRREAHLQQRRGRLDRRSMPAARHTHWRRRGRRAARQTAREAAAAARPAAERRRHRVRAQRDDVARAAACGPVTERKARDG